MILRAVKAHRLLELDAAFPQGLADHRPGCAGAGERGEIVELEMPPEACSLRSG